MGNKNLHFVRSKTGYILDAEVYKGKSRSDTTFIEELRVTGSLTDSRNHFMISTTVFLRTGFIPQ